MNFDDIIKVIIDNVTIVALAGEKGSGKDTSGEYLVEKYDFIRLALADPLKEACRHIFSFSDEQLYGSEKEVMDPLWNHAPRKLFQKIGTELLREQLPKMCTHITSDIWGKSLAIRLYKKYMEDPENNNKFVVTDVRFPNELAYVEKLGAISVKIIRKVEKNKFSSHASETQIKKLKTKYIIENNKDKSDLYKQLNFFAKNFLHHH